MRQNKAEKKIALLDFCVFPDHSNGFLPSIPFLVSFCTTYFLVSGTAINKDNFPSWPRILSVLLLDVAADTPSCVATRSSTATTWNAKPRRNLLIVVVEKEGMR